MGPIHSGAGCWPIASAISNSRAPPGLSAPEARAGIRFIHGNIMGPAGFTTEQTYDIIFCRNLLIYQHVEARGHIIATLDRLLKPEGLLFVGHAEMMSLLTERYEPVRHSGAFAYCKIKTRPCNAAPESVDAFGGAGVVLAMTQTAAGPAASPLPSSESRLEPKSRLEPESRLDCVRVLADRGQLDEATAMCQGLLKENPQLAEAHLLLGVIRTAAGQVQAAEECLNRALYLDADCYEALIHLSLLKARRGDEAGAERLRRHAERVRDHAKAAT